MWKSFWMSPNILSVSLVCFGSYFFHNGEANKDSTTELGKGFGEHISWKSLDKGLDEANSKQLPIMLIIHKSWCGACEALKPQFAKSNDIRRLSEYFVMVNAGDHDEPKEKKFAPDGSYFPRILFMNHKGEVLREFVNEQGNPNYKYYYSNPESIVSSMKKVISKVLKKDKVLDEL